MLLLSSITNSFVSRSNSRSVASCCCFRCSISVLTLFRLVSQDFLRDCSVRNSASNLFFSSSNFCFSSFSEHSWLRNISSFLVNSSRSRSRSLISCYRSDILISLTVYLCALSLIFLSSSYSHLLNCSLMLRSSSLVRPHSSCQYTDVAFVASSVICRLLISCLAFSSCCCSCLASGSHLNKDSIC